MYTIAHKRQLLTQSCHSIMSQDLQGNWLAQLELNKLETSGAEMRPRSAQTACIFI